jgi:hypothetical protein
MRLYGLTELAEATGLPLGTLRQWRSRGKLPAPTYTLKAGQFWQGREIEAWLSRTNRTDKEA